MVKRDIYFQFKSDFNKAAGEQISMGDIINISGPKDIKGKISKILVSVSYTHLDVYKRQAYNSPDVLEPPFRCLLASSG